MPTSAHPSSFHTMYTSIAWNIVLTMVGAAKWGGVGQQRRMRATRVPTLSSGKPDSYPSHATNTERY